ncbi:MAG: hypothetical protein WC956_03420 [bacterium]
MTALSDIRNIADLINFIWERDKDHNWTLSREEAPDIEKDLFERMSSQGDKSVVWAHDIAKYRKIPVTHIFFNNTGFLLLHDTKICGIWFKGGEFFSAHGDSYEYGCFGVLAKNTEINGRVYKADTFLRIRNGAVTEGTLVDGTVVGIKAPPPSNGCGYLLEDAQVTRSEGLVLEKAANASGAIRLPMGTDVCRGAQREITGASLTIPTSGPSISPLGGRFTANIEKISFIENAPFEVQLAKKIHVPVKKIIERIEAVVPLSIRSLVNFLPSLMGELHDANWKEIDNHFKYEPVSPRDLVTKILDSNARELDMDMKFAFDASGKPVQVSLLIPSFVPSLPDVRLDYTSFPTSMPYFDQILQIIDEELAAANPLPEKKTTVATDASKSQPTKVIEVKKPKGESLLPQNLRIEPSYQYLFGRGQRPGVELEGGFKAVGIGGEYARVIPSGDAKLFNEWRAHAAYRWEPIHNFMGMQIFMGARGRDDGEKRVGMEFGARASAMLTPHWLVDISPSYTVIKGANILDLGGGLGYKHGSIGASLGYRGIVTEGASSHGPRAGLFVWF